MSPRRILLAVAALASLAGACGHEVGDNCKTAADCDPNGTRVCDLSQPGGYCTMVGCDETTCPENSVCIRYFPEALLLSEQADGGGRCDPKCDGVRSSTADGGCPNAGADAGADGGTPIIECGADSVCLDSGVCAKRSYETRSCAHTCGNNGDCRGGYTCRPATSTGMLLLVADPKQTANVCAPTGP
ncbi:MAG TPA: hypothetical protein VHJ20_02575 [Polyangia bacterium]|nr:hypothetical protein [Polyangia bacterium]